MTIYRVETLEGALLDAAVAKAEGLSFELRDDSELVCWALVPLPPHIPTLFPQQPAPYYPSQLWGVGGPILDRERISLLPCYLTPSPLSTFWAAASKSGDFPGENMWGRTALEAAMRKFVLNKLGPEVDL